MRVPTLILFALHCAQCEIIDGSGGVALEVEGTEYDVLLDGKVFLRGVSTTEGGSYAPGLWNVSAIAVSSRRYSGRETGLGSFLGVATEWTAGEGRFTTHMKVCQDTPALLFEVHYPAAVPQSDVTATQNDVVTAFPAFLVGKGDTQLNQIAWNGNQLYTTNVSKWTHFWGGFDSGIPVLLYDKELRAAVIGPYGHALSSIHASSADGSIFAAGVKASVAEVPAGHVHRTLLSFGHGIAPTLDAWGARLLELSGKRPLHYSEDFVLSHLGYWTDNGAFYYHSSTGFANHEEALKAVKADALNRSIPIRYFQWDDYWFHQAGGDGGGLIEWQPQPEVFPSGMTPWLDAPLSLYMATYSSENVYIKDYDFFVDDTNHSLPQDEEFYVDLFTNGTDIGMRMFEQDLLSVMNGQQHVLSRNITVGETWMRAMEAAAVRVGVTLQFCMMDPPQLLQTAAMGRVTNGRGSRDAVGIPSRHLVLGLNALLFHALGMYLSSDNVRTSRTEGNLTRADPAYETVLGLLTGGPYGPSDEVGKMNHSLIMRTTRDDGLLLRAAKPIATLESTFALGFANASVQNIWSTHSDLGQYRWTYLLGLNLTEGYDLTVKDVAPRGGGEYLIWEYWGGPEGGAVLSETHPFAFPPCPAPVVQDPPSLGHAYYVVTPRLANNWIFIGEVGKIVTTSSVRHKVLKEDADSFTVHAEGSPAEAISWTVLSPAGKTLRITCSATNCSDESCPVSLLCASENCSCA